MKNKTRIKVIIRHKLTWKYGPKITDFIKWFLATKTIKFAKNIMLYQSKTALFK